jgi:hypothetical protein
MKSRHRPTPQVRNDGRQTGSSYISRSTTDRHTLPTARPGFTGSPNRTESLSTTADVDRHPKRKMATAKPEEVNISLSATDRHPVPKAVPTLLVSPDPTHDA